MNYADVFVTPPPPPPPSMANPSKAALSTRTFTRARPGALGFLIPGHRNAPRAGGHAPASVVERNLPRLSGLRRGCGAARAACTVTPLARCEPPGPLQTAPHQTKWHYVRAPPPAQPRDGKYGPRFLLHSL